MARSFQTNRSAAAEWIEQGRAALLAGEKERARELLQAAVRDDPDNVEAWLWLSGAQPSLARMADCLRQVLILDPGNPRALEGLAWVQEQQRSEESPAEVQGQDHLHASSAAASPPPVRVDTRSTPAAGVRARARHYPVPAVDRESSLLSGLVLLEVALHVASVGALLGLLRLVGMLRPGTLLLIRGSEGSIGAPAAIGLATAAAVLHGLALVLAWVALSRSIALARNDRRGDYFDSLLQAGAVFMPGYLAAGALLLTAAGLGMSERRWTPLALVAWALLLIGGALSIRRLARLLGTLRLRWERSSVSLLRVALPALLVAIAGLGLAGLAVQALLRAG